MAIDMDRPPSLAEENIRMGAELSALNMSIGESLREENDRLGRELFEENIRLGQELMAENIRLGEELALENLRASEDLRNRVDHIDDSGTEVDSMGEPIFDLEPLDEEPTYDPSDVEEGTGIIHIYKRNADELLPDDYSINSMDIPPDDIVEDTADTTIDLSSSSSIPIVEESPGDKLVRLLYTKYGKKKIGNHHCVTNTIDERGKSSCEFEGGLIDESGGKYDDRVLDEILNKILGIEEDPESLFYSEEPEAPPPPPEPLTAKQLFDMIRYKPKPVVEEDDEDINIKVCCGGGGTTIAPEDPGLLRPKVADIVFVIDTTGSMSTTIERIKANIREYVNSILSKGIDARFGIVAYGDINSSEPIVRKEFTSDIGVFDNYLATLPMYQGGDLPESTLDAINDTTNGARSFTFRADATRQYVVITDATSHSTADKKSTYSVAQTLTNLRTDKVVTSIIGTISGPQEEQLRILSDSTKGEYINIRSDFSDTLGRLADNINDSFYTPEVS